MAVYRLTPRAADDLDGIYEYTIVNFGLERARDHLNGLHRRLDDLAERPRSRARGRAPRAAIAAVPVSIARRLTWRKTAAD